MCSNSKGFQPKTNARTARLQQSTKTEDGGGKEKERVIAESSADKEVESIPGGLPIIAAASLEAPWGKAKEACRSQTMSNLHILCRDHPQRTIALVTADQVLVFQYSSTETKNTPRCQVEFSDVSSIDLGSYRSLGDGYGTLGLVTLGEDVFVCVITASSKVATVRPGETVSRIDTVDFCKALLMC